MTYSNLQYFLFQWLENYLLRRCLQISDQALMKVILQAFRSSHLQESDLVIYQNHLLRHLINFRFQQQDRTETHFHPVFRL